VTGASSFVGAHLARAFGVAGYDVAAVHSRAFGDYDRTRQKRLEHAASGARLVRLDLRDNDAAGNLVAVERPDIWIHHVGDGASYAKPDYDWIGILKLTARPLESLYPAFRETGTAVIVTGTDQEYGSNGNLSREADPCRPDTPYGLAKLVETLTARRLSMLHDVPTRVARVFLPFGRLDDPAKLVPQVIEALLAGKPIDLSAGNQKRDFIGVADVCRAYLALAGDMNRTVFDIFNISSGAPTPLRTLLMALAGKIGADKSLLNFGAIPMRPGEPPFSAGDASKARDILGWKPRPLAEALDENLPAENRMAAT
jgi:GDP-4-dehydro-6-deoxy-D-mannose reductase